MKNLLKQNVESGPSRDMAKDGFAYDWKRRMVDLRGLRPGEDGREPIFESKCNKRGES